MIRYKNIRIMDDKDLTVTSIAESIRNANRYEEYRVGVDVVLIIQDFHEQYPYVLALTKTKYDAIVCLLDSNDCGGG